MGKAKDVAINTGAIVIVSAVVASTVATLAIPVAIVWYLFAH